MGFRAVEGWGTLPEGWSFVEATSVGVDSRDDVHVFNRGEHPVIVFDRNGTFLRSWGEGMFRRAHGITGGPGTDPGRFNIPHNIATDREGLVYVADRENSRVQIFDGEGRYLAQWNNLHRPCGLYIDRAAGVGYVGELPTDLAVSEKVPNIGARVSVVTMKGDLVDRVGGPFWGEKPGEFIAPHGCVVDSHGDLYVAEVSWTSRGKH